MLKYNSLDFERIAFLLRAGDEKAFREMYSFYRDRLVGYCIKYTKSIDIAEEIVQEVFITIWEYREKLTADFISPAFIHTITKNRVIDFFRKAQRDKQLFNKLKENYTESHEELSETLTLSDLKNNINQAINQLSDQKQIVFKLSRTFGFTHQEIADLLGISKNTVKNHMVSSLKIIGDFLKKTGRLFFMT
jgi:RNA polymerase sigma-70 factor (ECF subfamily)